MQTVFRLIDAAATEDSGECEEELRNWSTGAWERTLRQLPMEANVFRVETGYSWDSTIESLDYWCQRFRARSDDDRRRYRPVYGHLGLLLVLLVSLRHSYTQRFARRSGAEARQRHNCDDLCIPMLQEPAVREALRALYAPEWSADAAAREEWDRIDFDSLQFHRHGTTSFILSGQSAVAVQGHRRSLALKCILFPYLRVPAITEATGSYMSRFGVQSMEFRHLAQVWASCGRWIMMSFVSGDTLAEHLSAPPEKSGLRIDLLAELGPKLFDALIELERAGLHHGDLSPSNIIVHESHGQRSLVLVDLGINYLHSRAISGSDGPDGGYVAPEIHENGQASISTDVYSLGLLLVAIAGPGSWPERMTPVPEELYAESPVLARFIEDLTGHEERNRLLILRPDLGTALYPQLSKLFEEELHAVSAAREGRPDEARDLLTPLNGAPGRAWRMWRIRRGQSLHRDSRHGMYVSYLMFWSWLSAAVWYLVGTIVVYWWLRDLGQDWGNQPISLLQQTTGSSDDEFPLLDPLREDDYPIEDFTGNLPVRMVAITSMLVCIRHYQNVLAGITPLIAAGRQARLTIRAWLAEAAMRLWSVGAPLASLPPTLVQRDWWPIALAAGVTCSFACNFWCLSFARAAMREARASELSTVPTGELMGMRRLIKWTWTNGLYAGVVWSIGTLIVLGKLDDELMYAVLVALINLELYVRSCSGSTAASVRADLTRACLAAERLRYLPRHP